MTVGARFPVFDRWIGALAASAEARGFRHDDLQLASGHVLGAVLASPFPNVFQIAGNDPGHFPNFKGHPLDGGEGFLLRQGVDFLDDVEGDSEFVHSLPLNGRDGVPGVLVGAVLGGLLIRFALLGHHAGLFAAGVEEDLEAPLHGIRQ